VGEGAAEEPGGWVKGPQRSPVGGCLRSRVGGGEAQDASSKLFLAVMLRSYPTTTTATVCTVGAKFLTAYLPAFGMEVGALSLSLSLTTRAVSRREVE
jgi:hypothetical protein